MIPKNEVEIAFLAKTPRAQYPVGAFRTYSKAKIHPFGEDTNHTHFFSNSCFSYVPQRGIASLRWKFYSNCVFWMMTSFRLSSACHSIRQRIGALPGEQTKMGKYLRGVWHCLCTVAGEIGNHSSCVISRSSSLP